MNFANRQFWFQATAVVCVALIAPGGAPLLRAQQTPAPAAAPAAADQPKLKTADQLDSLVAPIALYPDPLLAQCLAASTYPLDIVQAQRWLKANPKLQGEELTKAAGKQKWEASVQAMVAFPQALKLLDDNISWTTELGNSFLDQQSDVMDAVQRMRKKAKDAGKLASSKEQKVEVKTIENKTIVEIMPSNPQVIYVPQYEPTVVYGAPVYAYPPLYYPPYPYGYVAATAAISFGVGVAMGAMWGGCCGGGYGWGCGWGGNNNITVNNNFQNRYGYSNRTNVGNGNRGNGNWQHNPSHRGAVPYNNRATAQRFGGESRGANGRNERFDRNGNQRNSDRGAGNDRGNNRGSGVGGNNRGSGAANRDVGGNNRGGGGQDRMGNRSIGDQGRSNSAFGGGQSGRTQAASDRGFSSSRSSGGGGASRSYGGGGASRGGGGARSGGGRRR